MQRHNRNRIRLAISRSAREHRAATEDHDSVQLYVGNRSLPYTMRSLHHAIRAIEERTNAERRGIDRLVISREINGACGFLAGANESGVNLFGELCSAEKLSIGDLTTQVGVDSAFEFTGMITASGMGVVENRQIHMTPLGRQVRDWLMKFNPEVVES